MTLESTERFGQVARSDLLQISCRAGAGETRDGRRTPPGPSEPYDGSQDLLNWIGDHLERFGDIFKARAFGGDIYVVNHPQYAQHVLRRNWKNYKKGFAIKRIGLLLGRGLMVSEGEFWKAQRKLIQPAFHKSAVEKLAEVMQAANLALLDKWESSAKRRETINITRDVSAMALTSVLTSLFGSDYDGLEPHFRVLTDESVRDLEFAQAFKALRVVVGELVARRRKQGVQALDMLGMLMGMRDAAGGPAMSDAQLVSEVITIIVAGHETTASTLNWAWRLLSQHPAVEQRLYAEVKGVVKGRVAGLGDLPNAPLTRQVIDEAMRLYPAGWLMTRRALKDDQLGEHFVPAGTEIYISPYFMQRHPAFWDEPDRFDPDRFAPARSQDRPELAMLAFSAGPRNCIGELFARIEMQIHIMTLAKHLRLIHVEGPAPELDVGVNLRSKNDFMMVAELRGAHA